MLSIHWCLLKEYRKFIWSAGAAIIVFRSELAVFMGFILLTELLSQRISIVEFLKHTIPAGIVCLGKQLKTKLKYKSFYLISVLISGDCLIKLIIITI